MFSPSIGSFHSDVLSATPVSDEQKSQLIAEIKNRAKGSIGQRNFPEAIQLYTKAIEVCPESEAASKAILYSNRSMCYFGMNNFSHAVDDATASIELDPSYIKGYYRKTVALVSLDKLLDAREAVSEGLRLKPDDKELDAQLKKVESLLTHASQRGQDIAPSSSTVSASATPSSSSAPASKLTKPSFAAAAAAAVTTEDRVAADAADAEDEDGVAYRGYKKRADGRVTTFFNNDLDEQAKVLIGDIAPKKIESGAAVTPAAGAVVGSSWNSAGTFESRNLTSWAIETLSGDFRSIEGVPVNLPVFPAGLTLKVTEVKKIEGDSEIIYARGKCKRVCDLTAELLWQLSDADGSVTLRGSAKLEDITPDSDYEVVLTVPRLFTLASGGTIEVDANTHALIQTAIHSQLTACVNHFLGELAAKS